MYLKIYNLNLINYKFYSHEQIFILFLHFFYFQAKIYAHLQQKFILTYKIYMDLQIFIYLIFLIIIYF